MSWWDSFTSTIGSSAKRLTGGGAFLNQKEQDQAQKVNDTVRGALSAIDKELEATPAGKLAKAATKSTADFLLRGAVQLNNKIISPLITRPAATLGLLTDIESPLYKKGQFEEGFQFKDIAAAYERSAKVSTFQALTKSDLTPISGLAALVLPAGGIDMNKVDLWNDESIKQNFVDNSVGRWFTGIGDFFVGNKVFGIAGKATAGLTKAGAKQVGLYTKGKTVDDFAADMQTGIEYAKSNGAIGTQTVSGSHAVLLAETKDWGAIEDLVSKYSTNERLIPLIHEASDANVVADLLLADKGNLAALERLATTSSDKLFDMANVKGQIQNKFLQTGKVYLPEGAAVPRLQKAFDDAINNNSQFKKLKDAFFDEDYSLTPGGRAYMPMEPVIGANALIKVQEKIRNTKATIRSREFELPGFAETLLGETAGGLVLRGVRLAARGTEALPTGFVSFSGMRPLQARVELNGFLNNMKLFRDGAAKIETSPGTYEKVSDVRRRIEDKYMRTLGADSIEQTRVLKEIDTEVGTLLSYSKGMYNPDEIAGYVTEFQSNVSRNIESVKNNGFGVDIDGSVITVQPQTIRQLAESYRFTPWDDIESQIDIIDSKSGLLRTGKEAKRGINEAYQELTRLWTFDVLARPSYALKQSLFEPIISAGISQGLSFVWDDIVRGQGGNAARNLANWTRNAISTKVVNRGEIKAVNEFVGDKATALERAIRLKETGEAEVRSLLIEASPATKAQNLAAAQKELKAASKIVDNIELELRDAMVQYGARDALPTITTLERRVNYLKSKPGLSPRTSDIAAAEAAITNYRNTISKLVTNKKVITDADNAVQNAYAKIDAAVKELGDAVVKQADVFGKSAAFKKRYYSKEKHIVDVNGQTTTIDSFVQESSSARNNMFTAAVLEEVKNARTTEINYLGELTTGSTNSLIRRKRPQSRIGVTDPVYFEELAHIANRQYRGDPLIDFILGEMPMKDIQKWALTDTGRAYLRRFNVFETKEIAPYLAEKVSLVRRTFPSFEARAAILKGDVTSQQMQKFLAPYVDELYDIIPSNYNYGASTFGVGLVGRATEGLNNFSAKTFNKLASVENPIRAAMFDKMAVESVARKAAYLQQQGVEITVGRLNALRQQAGREALQEMEKTLYTINNPNRFLTSLRVLTAFPAANLNAFMRYGRLAAKEPVRALGFMYNYGRAFQTFGVDENGNPTNDINKITHLIVPGTSALSKLGLTTQGQDVTLSAQSLGFLLNRPSPSFVTSLAIGKVLQQEVVSEKYLQDAMTFGGTNWYKVFFPFGPPTDARSSFTPAWSKALVNSFVGPDAPEWQTKIVDFAVGPQARKDQLASWKSVYNHHAMLVEMGVEKDMPSDAEIASEVKSLSRIKFHSSFWSPFAGIPYKVDAAPMGITSRLYYKLQEKYKAEGMSFQDARDMAGEEMISLLGPKFMVDRVSFTGSNKNLNIPPTIEAYQRVFEQNDELVGKLADIDPNSIALVSILTGDLGYDPAEQSNNILTLLSEPNRRLPGTTKRLNELAMSPQEIEKERLKQRTWNQYSAIREALESKITDGKTLAGHPELKAPLDNLVETLLKGQSQEWYDEYQLSASGDSSYKYARALTLVTNDAKWMKKHGDSAYYRDAKTFIDARQIFAKFYQSLPDYDKRKGKLMAFYNEWVKQNAGQWDANLKTVITRYFDNDTLKVAD